MKGACFHIFTDFYFRVMLSYTTELPRLTARPFLREIRAGPFGCIYENCHDRTLLSCSSDDCIVTSAVPPRFGNSYQGLARAYAFRLGRILGLVRTFLGIQMFSIDVDVHCSERLPTGDRFCP